MQIAQKMLKQQLGDKLRTRIKDDRTYDSVSHYAQYFSDADYGTTHLAILAENGDAVSVTSTINYRLVKQKEGNEFVSSNEGSAWSALKLWLSFCKV